MSYEFFLVFVAIAWSMTLVVGLFLVWYYEQDKDTFKDNPDFINPFDRTVRKRGKKHE